MILKYEKQRIPKYENIAESYFFPWIKLIILKLFKFKFGKIADISTLAEFYML